MAEIKNKSSNMAAWIPAAISGVASLAGSLLNNSSNLRATREYNQAQRELAAYQNQWNLAQWHRENEYNSPAAQMARYQEAGLNPNLIYGNGSSAGNTSSSSVRAVTPNLDVYNRNSYGVGEAISSAVNTYMATKQMQMMDHQIDKIKQDTINAGIRQTQMELANSKSKMQNNILERTLESQVQAKQLAVEQMNRNLKYSDAQTKYITSKMELLPIEKQLKSKSLKSLDAQIKLLADAHTLKEKEIAIKSFEAKLAQEGIRPQDPLWMRYVLPAVRNLTGMDLGSLFNLIGKGIGKESGLQEWLGDLKDYVNE